MRAQHDTKVPPNINNMGNYRKDKNRINCREQKKQGQTVHTTATNRQTDTQTNIRKDTQLEKKC